MPWERKHTTSRAALETYQPTHRKRPLTRIARNVAERQIGVVSDIVANSIEWFQNFRLRIGFVADGFRSEFNDGQVFPFNKAGRVYVCLAHGVIEARRYRLRKPQLMVHGRYILYSGNKSRSIALLMLWKIVFS